MSTQLAGNQSVELIAFCVSRSVICEHSTRKATVAVVVRQVQVKKKPSVLRENCVSVCAKQKKISDLVAQLSRRA